MTELFACLKLAIFFDELKMNELFALHSIFRIFTKNCLKKLFELFRNSFGSWKLDLICNLYWL